jgi:phage head maturation protease
MSETENEAEVENLTGGEFVHRTTDTEPIRFTQEGDAEPVLTGRMMPYGQWTEIRSRVEGHFLERFARGSLVKTMNERLRSIRILYEHGLDFLGKQPIAEFESFEERDDGGYYSAPLLRKVPELLVEGLSRGLYGSSVRFKPMQWDRVRSPKRSEFNPDGIEERTVREAYIKEFSVVTFPQYEGATAGIRSLTDEVAAKQLLGDPVALLEALNTATGTRAEPQHSEREEPEDQAPEPSRSTQPVHDYLRPEEDESSWRL